MNGKVTRPVAGSINCKTDDIEGEEGYGNPYEPLLGPGLIFEGQGEVDEIPQPRRAEVEAMTELQSRLVGASTMTMTEARLIQHQHMTDKRPCSVPSCEEGATHATDQFNFEWNFTEENEYTETCTGSG